MPSLDRLIRLDVSNLAAGVPAALLQEHPLVRVAGETVGVREYNEIHYDTPQLQLFRHGISLSIHRREEQWIQRCTRQQAEDGELQWLETPLPEAQLDLKPLRKMSLFPILTVADIRSMEAVFTLHCRESRWTLTIPDGVTLALIEERGYWKSGIERYPFHELLLQYQAGSMARWYQTAMEIAWSLFHREAQEMTDEASKWERCGPALLSSTPAQRAFAALQGSVLLVEAKPAAESVAVPDTNPGAESDTFYPLAEGMTARQLFDHLAGGVLQAIEQYREAVLYGAKQDKLAQIVRLHRHVERLQTLFRLYDPLLPRTVAAEVENEIGWLTKELLLVQECRILQDVTLEPLLQQVVRHDGLAALLQKTRNGLQLAVKRLEKALSGFRCTRLLLGLHSWLQGGLWDFLSDPLVREELEAPLQRRAADWLQDGYQQVLKQGRLWQELPLGDRSALVRELDRLGHTVLLFGDLFANKRGRIGGDGRLLYIQALQRMQESLHRLLHIESSQRFLLRGVNNTADETAVQAIQAWQAARMERALAEAARSWEMFVNKLSFWT